MPPVIRGPLEERRWTDDLREIWKQLPHTMLRISIVLCFCVAAPARVYWRPAQPTHFRLCLFTLDSLTCPTIHAQRNADAQP